MGQRPRRRQYHRGIPETGRSIRCTVARRANGTAVNSSNNSMDMASGKGDKINATGSNSNRGATNNSNRGAGKVSRGADRNSRVVVRNNAKDKGSLADSPHGKDRRRPSQWRM
jgi:hypothetical protein